MDQVNFDIKMQLSFKEFMVEFSNFMITKKVYDYGF